MKYSTHREHKGLIKTLKCFADSSVQVETLITDRRKRIAKYMREHEPSVDHQYDVWQISKGIHNNYHIAKCICKVFITDIFRNKEAQSFIQFQSLCNHC